MKPVVLIVWMTILATAVVAAPVLSSGTRPASIVARDWWVDAVRVEREGVSSMSVAGDVVELRTDVTPPSPWSAQIALRVPVAVTADDLLLIEVDLRTTAVDPDSKESALRIVLQQADPPYATSDTCVAQPTTQWIRHRLPLRAKSAYPGGKSQIALQFGTCRQRVQVRGLSVTNLGNVPSAGVRFPAVSYVGREADAAWRKSAEARIERLRKGDLVIRVIDDRGVPIAGAQVSIELTKHSFPFGTAVTKRRILGDTADDERYRQILKQYFNAATFEYDMKWPIWENGNRTAQRDQQRRTLAAADWLKREGFFLRGQCLVWPELQRLPPDVREMIRRSDRAALALRVNRHIDRMTRTFAGKVNEWDVVNEPTFHRALQDVLGDRAIIDWFRRAHLGDGTASLALNDFAMLSYGALNESRIAETIEIVRSLQNSGAPLHTIGEQAHFDDVLVGTERMLQLFDRFAEFGLPIRITELDIATEDEQLQADYLRDIFITAFSHPSVNGIVQWGFYEKNHWKPKAALWRADWSRRPAGDEYVKLLTQTWHTSAAGRTAGDGRFGVRGFYGEYKIVIRHDGREKVLEPRLPEGGMEISVRF